MDPNPLYYEIYRSTSLGTTLSDALNDLITSSHITADLAMRVIQNFDRSVALVLNEYAKKEISFKGRIETYRNFDDAWMWVVRDVRFKKMEGGEGKEGEVGCERLKVVACRAKKMGVER